MRKVQFAYRSEKEKCKAGYIGWLIGYLPWFFGPFLPGYKLMETLTWLIIITVYLSFLVTFPISYPLLILIKMHFFKKSMCGGCNK